MNGAPKLVILDVIKICILNTMSNIQPYPIPKYLFIYLNFYYHLYLNRLGSSLI